MAIGGSDQAWEQLKSIKQPVLVVDGSNDVIIYTIKSYILQQNLPSAQVIIYADSAHGPSSNIRTYSSVTSRCSSMKINGRGTSYPRIKQPGER